MSATPHNFDDDLPVTTVGFRTGQHVGSGRYTLQRLLGQGGMGVVWLAHDERLDEDAALKFLPPQIRADPTALDDLRRETLRSRKLTHPNIMRIHDLFEAENQDPFISMEFVDGPTLAVERLKQPGRVFAWEHLGRLVRQLCEALEYAHGEHIIHRDLKPANLMLNSQGRLKLADFGIARVVTDSMSRISARQGTSGTMVYMSPQQMDGKLGHPTDDIYSLGATIYELLTSKPPFYTGDLAHQVRYATPDKMADRLTGFGLKNQIPAIVEETIAACLDKDPTKRPQSAHEVAERLGLVEIPTASARTRPAVVPPAAAAPEPRRAWLAICAWVALAGLAGWYFGVHLPGKQRAAEQALHAVKSATNEMHAKLEQERARLAAERAKLATDPPKPPTQEDSQRKQKEEDDRRKAEEAKARIGAEAKAKADAEAKAAADKKMIAEAAAAKALAEQKAQEAAAAKAESDRQAAALALAKLEAERKAKELAEAQARAAAEALRLKYPGLDRAWTNGLGMRFAPVPGADALFSIWETRVQDYKAFVEQSRQAGDVRWKNPPFTQTPLHPVVNVSWPDAQAFCKWLTESERQAGKLLTNQLYRLPTDLEWSLAAGLEKETGKTPAERHAKVKGLYLWGTNWPPATNVANFWGRETGGGSGISGFTDPFVNTAPVGSFATNAMGLFDLSGNVWEWCQDSFSAAVTDRVTRGGSWHTHEQEKLLRAHRETFGPQVRLPYVGFRCVLDAGRPAAK